MSTRQWVFEAEVVAPQELLEIEYSVLDYHEEPQWRVVDMDGRLCTNQFLAAGQVDRGFESCRPL